MGRPRTFDEHQVLDRARDAFWSAGYRATRVEDIAAASGLGNGSIYSAYGSKLDLFLIVLRRYCDDLERRVESVVDRHSGTFESAVLTYLDAIIADCTTHPSRRGCLMLNSLTELGSQQPEVVEIGDSTVRALEAVLRDRVVRAVADGELDLAEDDCAALAAHIVLVSQGLIQLSRTGATIERLHTIARTSSRMSSLLVSA